MLRYALGRTLDLMAKKVLLVLRQKDHVNCEVRLGCPQNVPRPHLCQQTVETAKAGMVQEFYIQPNCCSSIKTIDKHF